MNQNKLVVISGCSGGGKSTLLTALTSNGYSTIPEIGREIVKEQLAINGEITPWQDETAFCEMMIERSVVAYHNSRKLINAKAHVIFFDRSFLEGISYYQTLKKADANKYDYIIHDLRYHSIILVTPPWREIYCQDDERKHSYEDAVQEHERLLLFYAKYGYQVTQIPKVSVPIRVKFVLSAIC
jgi:predicted ATPase